MRKSKVDPTLIPELVDKGLSDQEIAQQIGCTVGTLRVKCSQFKISLRRKMFAGQHYAIAKSIFDQFSKRAEMMGIPPSKLAADLLEAIVRDNLYNAVLDKEDETTIQATVN